MGFYELVACQKTSVSDSLVSGTNEKWPWLIALFSAGCDKLTNWSESTSQLKLTCCWFLRRDTHRCYFSFSKFLPPSSPLYEELDLPRTAENEAVPCRLCCGFCSVWRADRRQPWNISKNSRAFHFFALKVFLGIAFWPTSISICCAFFLLHWLHWRTSQAGWFGFATCWSQVEQEVHPPISNWWKSMRVMAFLVQLVQFHSVCVSIGAVCWQNCRVFQVNVVGTAFLLAYHHALVREISATFSG